MARIRSLKPGFFHNEILAECEPLARILFMGLWGIANFEGVLEDRPKRIKAQVLPYDECDVENLLDQLAQHKFILRKTIDEKSFLYIPTFQRHQNPHKKEREGNNTLPMANRFNDNDEAGRTKSEHAPKLCRPKKEQCTESAFNAFWEIYPRKSKRADAERIWNEIDPDGSLTENILTAVGEQTESIQWSQDGGRYIPNPANWLAQNRWEDQLPRQESLVSEFMAQEGNPFQ